MNDAVFVRVLQSAPNLHRDANRRIRRNLLVLGDVLLQRLARHILHDDVIRVAVMPDVVNPDNVRMRQFPRRLRFMPETHDKFPILRKLAVQHFRRHHAIEHRISRFIHIGHPARADFFQELIAIVQQCIDHITALLHLQSLRRPEDRKPKSPTNYPRRLFHTPHSSKARPLSPIHLRGSPFPPGFFASPHPPKAH